MYLTVICFVWFGLVWFGLVWWVWFVGLFVLSMSRLVVTHTTNMKANLARHDGHH